MVILKNENGQLNIVPLTKVVKRATITCECGACIEISISQDNSKYQGSIKQAIVALVEASPGELSGRQIAEELGFSHTWVKRDIRDLIRDKLIHRKKGSWGLYPGPRRNG